MLHRLRADLRQVVFLMARRPGLVCGAIALSGVLVLAVTLTCSGEKEVVVPARTPVRFFSADAPVVDLYLGQLEQVERLRGSADVSLVFFYAPWCAHSIAARDEVQEVARRLAKKVQFIAVNCWWNMGKCRKQKVFYQYPAIHLFYRRFGPIDYKGPLKAAYVERFIHRVITPLTYLPSRATLQDFLSTHEPGVVGFFNFSTSPQPPGYTIYLSSALQALKRDFLGSVRFGVVTSARVAAAISVSEDQTVYLHRHFNSSLVFPRAELNFTSEGICSWVFEHRETVLSWLQPHGGKSRLLESELVKGPALLLFLPHNPLGDSHPALLQMADIALRYHSCNVTAPLSDPGVTPPFSLSPTAALCCHMLAVPAARPPSGSGFTVCEVCVDRAAPCVSMEMEAVFASYFGKQPVALMTEACCSFLSAYNPFSHYSACCRTPPPNPMAGVTGLRCRTNKTLRFYLLDSHLHWTFAVRLGALGNNSREGQMFVTIVNLLDESQYVLDHSTGLEGSLERFIRNFSAPYSLLQRHLVGGGGPSSSEGGPRPLDSLITEVTTTSFFDIVMDPERDVLLFYYTQWCGFCSVLNHVIIQLARLFQGNGKLSVARVNGARNDLPWEFMVDRFPVILLFPRHRKHLSVKFPEDKPITLPNLVHFILKHLGDAPRGQTRAGSGLLEAEFHQLQGEVHTLQRALDRLSQQLSELWSANRRLSLHTRVLEAQNAELQRQKRSLEELHRQKSRQLGDAQRRLQELSHTSQHLLRVLLTSARERERSGDEEEVKNQAA